MRIIYLFGLFIIAISISLDGQSIVPLRTNPVLERMDGQLQEPLSSTKNKLQKSNGIDFCSTPNEAIIYVTQGAPFTTDIEIDTTGLDTLAGTFTCTNCDQLNFGQVSITSNLLTYTVNETTTAGREQVSVEFCNPNGCNSTIFEFIARRRNQVLFPQTRVLNAEASTQIEIDTTQFPGLLDCIYIMDCEDGYEGRTQRVDFFPSNPVDFRFEYTASRYAGIDSVCVVLCDTFGICDQYHYSFRIIQDTIDVPFMDDFSQTSPTTNPLLWLDDEVFVNRTMGIDPPTVGVATFDGVNHRGEPYGGGYGVADRLTSTYLDLRGRSENELILRYWLQPQGLVDKPEPQDSLVLEFKNFSGKWEVIRALPGLPTSQPNTVENPFVLYSVPIEKDYLYNGFQFRFKNYSNRTGILDTWHLDVVRIDDIGIDTIFSDVAFVDDPLPILNNYSSMPWKQFQGFGTTMLRDSIVAEVNNFNDQQISSGSSTVRLRELKTGTDLFRESGVVLFNNQAGDFPSQQKTERIFSLDNSTNNFVNIESEYFDRMTSNVFDGEDRLEFLMFYHFSPSSQITDIGYESVINNDSVSLINIFDNYFAYDDGTAEAGLVAQEGNSIAVKFTTSVEDSLRAVQFHFPHTSIDVGDQRFHLKVWLDSLANDPIYERFDIVPFYTSTFFDSLQGFTTYVITDEFGRPTPLYLPPGDFFVGWEQANECSGLRCIPVGYDYNSPNGKAAISILNGGRIDTTLASFLPEGSLMIRPIVGSQTPPATVNTNDQFAGGLAFSIFPNPAQSQINLQTSQNQFNDQYQFIIYDLAGRTRLLGSNTTNIDVTTLENGMYWIKVFDEIEGQFGVRKLMINR